LRLTTLAIMGTSLDGKIQIECERKPISAELVGRGDSGLTKMKFYGGVDEVGGNRILVEDGDTRIFLDFGLRKLSF